MNDSRINFEEAVAERYSAAAKERTPSLCCPVKYNDKYLAVIPAEILDRDYGCGDPSEFLNAGETVLDLGSGGGKICYIAAQVVGPTGRVIGVDMNDEMLALARKYQDTIARKLGFTNVQFRKGKIQDLALDIEKLDEELSHTSCPPGYLKMVAMADELRRTKPLVATESVDVVVSSCVLNLVEPAAKRELFNEIFRVLRKGGRTVISDIVSDQDVPAALQRDPVLWSGCLAGAFREDLFLQAFADAGLHGIRILKRDRQPWRTVEGIEFRSVTIEAFKQRHARTEEARTLIYKGPFKEVVDDEDHRFKRGIAFSLCGERAQALSEPPYLNCFEIIDSGERAFRDMVIPQDAAGRESESCC